MPTTIHLSIKNCLECPYCKSERHWTSDSWEHAYDYFCGINYDKSIATYIERPSEMPDVPDWCPLRVK